MTLKTLDAIDADARLSAERTSVPEMAAWLQDLLGQKLTAAVVGIRSPRKVGTWARGECAPGTRTQQHLRDAYRIAWMLRQADAPETIRSWFVGLNPHLDDSAPAAILAKDPDRVLHAARAFLAGN